MLVVTTPTRPDTTYGVQVVDALADAIESAHQAGLEVCEVRTNPPPARRRLSVGPAATSTLPWHLGLRVSSFAWDGFFGTPLDSILRSRGRDQLMLCGWWLETAVHSTMRSANDRGYECLLLSDLTVAFDDRTTRGALSSIEMSGGIFGAVGTGAAALEAVKAQPVEEFIS